MNELDYVSIVVVAVAVLGIAYLLWDVNKDSKKRKCEDED